MEMDVEVDVAVDSERGVTGDNERKSRESHWDRTWLMRFVVGACKSLSGVRAFGRRESFSDSCCTIC